MGEGGGGVSRGKQCHKGENGRETEREKTRGTHKESKKASDRKKATQKMSRRQSDTTAASHNDGGCGMHRVSR